MEGWIEFQGVKRKLKSAIPVLAISNWPFFKGFHPFLKALFKGSYPFLRPCLKVPILFVKAFFKGNHREIGNIWQVLLCFQNRSLKVRRSYSYRIEKRTS